MSNTTIPNKVVVVAGGFPDETNVFCNQDIDIHNLEANHEEADKHMILHCVHAKSNTIYCTLLKYTVHQVVHESRNAQETEVHSCERYH